MKEWRDESMVGIVNGLKVGADWPGNAHSFSFLLTILGTLWKWRVGSLWFEYFSCGKLVQSTRQPGSATRISLANTVDFLQRRNASASGPGSLARRCGCFLGPRIESQRREWSKQQKQQQQRCSPSNIDDEKITLSIRDTLDDLLDLWFTGMVHALYEGFLEQPTAVPED
jgi:hypothetical protein